MKRKMWRYEPSLDSLVLYIDGARKIRITEVAGLWARNAWNGHSSFWEISFLKQVAEEIALT
jgi:hypothetical protein